MNRSELLSGRIEGFVEERAARLTVEIGERNRVDEALKRSLKEKEIFLQEICYRVKNNLNVISSLLDLQSSAIKSPDEALAAFENSRDRVASMALVHEELYKSRDHAQMDMRNYIEDLGRNILEIHRSGRDIRLETRVEEGIMLNLNTAVPCGLILTELITNAFKHAFPSGRAGTIGVGFRIADDGLAELSVSDDGVGTAKGFDPGSSLGLTLIRLLSEQIGGSLTISGVEGMRCVIKFPREGKS